MVSSNVSGSRRYGRKKKTNGAQTTSLNEDFSGKSGCCLNALLSVILSPVGMKAPVLKDLYELLLRLSYDSQWVVKNAAGSHDFELSICNGGITASFQSILELSNVLFKELDERFEQFLKYYSISVSKDWERTSYSGIFDSFEVTVLLFRNCMLLLSLLEPQQNLILEKGEILFRILRKLNMPKVPQNTGKHRFSYEKSVFRECSPGNNGCSTSCAEDFTASLQFLEPHNPLHSVLTTMLEVSVDELLSNGKLRGCFKVLNSIASGDKILFNPSSNQEDIAIVMEAICSHFILSMSDMQVFGDFFNQLFCAPSKRLRYPTREPALGVAAAVSVFLSPVMDSAPKYMQAHLYSLVSEAIDIKILKPDRKHINYFLSAFEKSVTMYMKHMTCLRTDVSSTVFKDLTSNFSHGIAHLPFESYILPETKHKVDSLVANLDNYSDTTINDCCFRMKSDLVSSSMRFVKEFQDDYSMPCKDEILIILSCLVLKTSECFDENAVHQIKGTSLQQLYLLASVLRLMSISLIQSIWCFRHKDESGSMKTLKDFSSCKEYDFLLGVISCFRNLDVSFPLQKDLFSAMSNHSRQHMDSKMMFLHFSGLMFISFVSGLDCLVKASLLANLALLNLFVFEEGNVDVLQSFVDSNKESFSSRLSGVRLQETVADQSVSLVVASKFQKIRNLYSGSLENNSNEKECPSSQNFTSTTSTEAVAGLEEETEETTNGEIFLRCMLQTDGVSDFDDLASFVECKQGKDYSAWLKNRQRYRRWKSEKMAVLKWKKKKKTWKILKANRD
ncbi:uncharacterized protein LOC127255421 [Andrographis paniculata]|uniref:uncharacterized protein LOC127255421 n=1 Tax=Andrographis paniculata TaxID=175694 RepID=UPI0021E86C51|nr:uncharacterized protein LOC127255421 [Andrographis paniculata]XP_051136889.1 uncharacterized protein LOC127255421 [Andrographis paniculata]